MMLLLVSSKKNNSSRSPTAKNMMMKNALNVKIITTLKTTLISDYVIPTTVRTKMP